MTRRIAAAAIKTPRGLFTLPWGKRHADILNALDNAGFHKKPEDLWVQGFVDAQRRFLTRTEAFLVAQAAGQLIRPKDSGYQGDELFTEDLF